MPHPYWRLLYVAGMVLFTASCDSSGDQELGRRISLAAQANDVGLVNVPELATFTWDRLFIFPPYTTSSEVEKQLGFSWSESGRMASRDDAVLLVFVDRGRITRFVDQPRSDGDFTECYRRGGFPRSDATFRFRRGVNGRRHCAK